MDMQDAARRRMGKADLQGPLEPGAFQAFLERLGHVAER